MPNLIAQLKRDGHLLSRPPKVKKGARKRVKPVSDKRRGANRDYLKRRAAYLLAHPYCQALNTIHPYLGGCDMDALRKSPWAPQKATEIHHRKRPRSRYLNDESTWLAVCRWSHEWIHNHPQAARSIGLLV